VVVASAWLVSATCSSSGTCTGSLSEVGAGCPATFDGALDVVTCIPYETLETYACGTTTVLVAGGGYTSGACVYDAATRALVGARVTTDTNEYCGGTSFRRSAGQLPDDACLKGAPVSTRSCGPPDGGASEGATTDAVSE
jgi:hypothetical protein